jgi:hypothetical protein
VPVILASLHAAFFFVPAALAGAHSRYALAPLLLLYALVAWGLVRAEGPRSRLLKAAATAGLVLICALDFAPANRRSAGPRWSAQLAKARRGCTANPQAPASLVVPPLPPGDLRVAARRGEVWIVTLPCDALGERHPVAR